MHLALFLDSLARIDIAGNKPGRLQKNASPAKAAEPAKADGHDATVMGSAKHLLQSGWTGVWGGTPKQAPVRSEHILRAVAVQLALKVTRQQATWTAHQMGESTRKSGFQYKPHVHRDIANNAFMRIHTSTGAGCQHRQQ